MAKQIIICKCGALFDATKNEEQTVSPLDITVDAKSAETSETDSKKK